MTTPRPVVFAALATLALADAGLAQQPDTRPPNIVHVMADELGYFELSCMGNANLRTPNLDRMADEGMRFVQMLAGSAVCAPTRACLLTGKHSGHTSVRSNGGGTPLRAGETTIASLLKTRGYATGGFGKWGCGGRGSTGVPEQHGFDEFFGYYDQVHAHSYFPAYLIRNSEEVPLRGNTGGRTGASYAHYAIFDAGIEFVRAHADQPFFCYLPVTPPHGMFDIPDSDPAWAMYADEPWPMEARRYAAMVTMLDRQVGELIALLAELGIEDDTIVVFSGDNGGDDYFASSQHPRGFHGANVDPRTGVEFRGKKRSLHEGGLRIPMIARWPNHIDAGTVSDHLCYFPDLLPTFAELAAAEIPDDIDGISIVPTLLGEATAGRVQPEHEYLYWEFGGQTAVRSGDWKAYRGRPDAAWELYDLGADISEAHDVASEQAGLLEKLVSYAAAAHEPVREGTFQGTALHERDRRAKWGENAPQNGGRRSLPWSEDGLIPRAGFRLVRASSESTHNHKIAANAFDGDPGTIWHTRFHGELARPPHELVIDLGARYAVAGFRYMARQDRGWNGTIASFEFSVSDDPDAFPETPAKGTLAKTRRAQDVTFPARTGRYVRLRALSEVGDGPWASVAELGVIGG